jgi:hypothetical protein
MMGFDTAVASDRVTLQGNAGATQANARGVAAGLTGAAGNREGSRGESLKSTNAEISKPT